MGHLTFVDWAGTLQGQLECERCAAARALALNGQRSTELPCGERTAMQAKPMTSLARRKPVTEDACQILRGNADTVVDDTDLQPLRAVGNAQGDTPILLAGF